MDTMSMSCDVCHVSLNSSSQLEQHLAGQSHAKRLRQQEGGHRPQGQVNQGQGNHPGGQGQGNHPGGQGQGNHPGGQGQGRPPQGHGWGCGQDQGPSQGPGQGRGRPIRGGRGGMFEQGGGGMQGQGLMPFSPQLPGLEPLVMNALNISGASMHTGNMGMGRSGQPITGGGGGGQMFNPGSDNRHHFGHSPETEQTFRTGQPFPGGSPTFPDNTFVGGSLPFSEPRYRDRQGFTENPTPDNEQSFSNRTFQANKGQSWPAKKKHRPKQAPPPPKPKKPQADFSEPLVFEDNMGVVSVSMEGENQLFCDMCCVTMTSPDQAYNHYRGARHIKRARVARLREVGGLEEDMESEETGDVYCSFCNITVNSLDQMRIHEAGAKHKKMVEQRKRKPGHCAGWEPYTKRMQYSMY